MNRKPSIALLTLVVLLLTSCTTASFSGNYILGTGQTLRGNLFVTSGTVTLEENSYVSGTILLTSGVLKVDQGAQVGGDVALTSGDVYLADGAVIHGDLILSSTDINVHQSPGAVIEGNTTNNIAPFIGSIVTKGILLYCVLPIVLLIVIILVLGTWLGRQSKKRPEVIQPQPAMSAVDTQSKLQNLKQMLDQGLITKDDYENKKTELLSQM